ncbi:MAG: hypothetical protein H7X99_01650 [Saprospiraceae bacterium]|nr:hypothetical protein [Saprospiraceae bacterium]
MAEINFYINDLERGELFDFLFSNEIRLYPSKKYNSSNLEVVENRKKFLEAIEEEAIRFYCISKHFSVYTLYLEKNEFSKNENSYYIKDKYGGPYFDISFYRGFADDAGLRYKCTSLFHYPRYIKLQEEYEEFKVNDELKEYFRRTIEFLKSKCKKVKVNDRFYWVSIDVCKEINLL